jgi:hypothetical protein
MTETTVQVTGTVQATEYVILEAESGAFVLAPGKQTARSADQAVKQHAQALMAEGGEADGTYVAVPARSWAPRTIKSRVALDFGEAS